MRMRVRRKQRARGQGPSSRSGREALGPSLAIAASLALLSSCGAPCRGIDTRPLELECAATSTFTGELHVDSEATFDTFLRQDCLAGNDAEADRVLASVDFRTEAVFVARGSHRVTNERCLESRDLDEAQVCTTGLKLYFLDEERSPEGCPSTQWTVALVLSRDDMRAALEAAGP